MTGENSLYMFGVRMGRCKQPPQWEEEKNNPVLWSAASTASPCSARGTSGEGSLGQITLLQGVFGSVIRQ